MTSKGTGENNGSKEFIHLFPGAALKMAFEDDIGHLYMLSAT